MNLFLISRNGGNDFVVFARPINCSISKRVNFIVHTVVVRWKKTCQRYRKKILDCC